MSRGTQVALAAFAWLAGFVFLRRFGTVLPLFAMAVALAAFLAGREGDTRARLRPGVKAIGVGLAAGAVQIAATYLLYPLCVRAWPPLAGEVRGLQGLLFHGQPRLAVAALVVSMSTAEEILFRGRLLTSRRAVLPAAIFYAAVHATSGSAVLVALAFACGLFWGALRQATGSLWTSIVCHVAWDVAIMVVAPL
jgi:membrane protease YdiL (CAAX protease family)